MGIIEFKLYHLFYNMSFLAQTADKSGGIWNWITENVGGVLAVIFVFGFMIFVHELGHFLMAKKVGITVHEFALGFGPKLLSFGGNKKKEEDEETDDKNNEDKNENSEENKTREKEPVKTEYCLRAIPMGGFVSMEGEDEPGDLDDPGNFNNKSATNRLKVILAGCVMNYITGILLLIFIGFAFGVPMPKTEDPPAVVGSVLEGYPLEGVAKIGDEILKVNDEEIEDFEELSGIISQIKDGSTVTLTVKRAGEIKALEVPVMYDKERDKGMLGFAPMPEFGYVFEKKPAGTVIMSSLYTTGKLTAMPYFIVKLLVTKQMTAKQVGQGTAGPLGISQMLFEVSKLGFPTLLYMCAMLSILIGAFNLLPIPALDGSRALFIIIEGIRKKPVNPELEGMIHNIGFIVLMIFVLVVTFNDILRIIRGDSIIK
ncbi:MAG: M50 family metallopeptidase [Vulcanimicrobiota bacterium]